MMMQSEGAGEGTPPINKNIIIDLTDTHLRLLKDPAESEYIATYYNTLPHIVALRARDRPGDARAGDLLYGAIRLPAAKVQQGDLVGDQASVDQITKLLRLLSEKYNTVQ